VSRTKHTEAQMIGALKQMEAGRKAEDVGSRGIEAHDLCLEGEVRRNERERGAGSETVARGEHATAEAGGGPESGQRHAAGADPKKRVELVDQRVGRGLAAEQLLGQRGVRADGNGGIELSL
jgi:hypothetical protein